MNRSFTTALCTLTLGALPLPAQESPAAPQPGPALLKAFDFLQAAEKPARSLRVSGELVETKGMLEKLQGARFELQLQPPRHIKLTVTTKELSLTICQNARHLWIYVPGKNFLVTGDTTVPRFSNRPESTQASSLDLLRLPVSRTELALLPALISSTQTTTTEGGMTITLTPSPAAAALPLPVKSPSISVNLGAGGGRLNSLRYQDSANAFTLRMGAAEMGEALPEATWMPTPDADDRQETVALAHLERFFKTALASIGGTIPSLPPVTGERWLLGSSGAGRLEDHDGTRVLFLSGTPEQMGQQHGTLMKPEIRRLVDRVLYGVGVGSSFEKGRWFFGEIEEAVSRSAPFIDPRHLIELDAMAVAAGVEKEEMRLANFFPELFHCSGFALLGEATTDGKIYHGRVLDYLRGVGLEETATVIINRPDQGNAWVNIGYAGFTGSVTAMNEKQLSIGEMGGRGEGNWDGKPMAQLMREVMEKTSTLDEALDFMRRTPRTCEYYYVLADAKSHRAAGVKATPTVFEVIWTGESHPQLPKPVKDTVILSAGQRYETLAERVSAGFGKFGVPEAIKLMSPPVCMNSNIHSVLFAPDTLDFWVANADSKNVASETRYTAYNLKSLLESAPAASRPKVP